MALIRVSNIGSDAIADGSITGDDFHTTVDFDGKVVLMPRGTTAERPGTPQAGMLRYNTEFGVMEQYSADGWVGVASPPTVTAVSPSGFNGASGTSFTITGSNFASNSTVKFITSGGTEVTAGSVTRNSATELVATTPQAFSVADEPLSVKVTSRGLDAQKDQVIDCGGVPTWTTAAGALTDQVETAAVSETLVATDPDAGTTITYALTSGSLPPGLSLNAATGAITGTAPSVGASGTTYNFTVEASDDGGNTSSRSFSMFVASAAPVWATSSGTLTTQARTGSVSTSISATSNPAAGTQTYTVSSGSLPNGLSLNSSSGAITGTISSGTTKQTWNFTVTAANTIASADRSFGITVVGNTIGAATNAQYYPGCATGTNRKSQFDAACVGLESCTFNPLNYGDPAPGSSKSFKLEFPCTVGTYSTCVSAEAGRNVTHSCPN